METNERTPARWDNATAASVLRIVGGYVVKWSGPNDERPLNPEAREEVTAAILFDIMTGPDIPDGIPLLRHVFRTCRLWRIRNWWGDSAEAQREKRAAQRAARAARENPGSAESEESRNKSPYRGHSDDSRQPTPLAQLVAIESASREGLRYVSDRQAKQRRRAVKGHRRAIVRTVPGPVVGTLTIDTDAGTWNYAIGSRQGVSFVREDGGPVAGKRGEGHRGTIDNRAIGKTKTVPVPAELCGWAILGRNERRRFSPAPLATLPPTNGEDRTTARPAVDDGWQEVAPGHYVKIQG